NFFCIFFIKKRLLRFRLAFFLGFVCVSQWLLGYVCRQNLVFFLFPFQHTSLTFCFFFFLFFDLRFHNHFSYGLNCICIFFFFFLLYYIINIIFNKFYI